MASSSPCSAWGGTALSVFVQAMRERSKCARSSLNNAPGRHSWRVFRQVYVACEAPSRARAADPPPPPHRLPFYCYLDIPSLFAFFFRRSSTAFRFLAGPQRAPNLGTRGLPQRSRRTTHQITYLHQSAQRQPPFPCQQGRGHTHSTPLVLAPSVAHPGGRGARQSAQYDNTRGKRAQTVWLSGSANKPAG